MSEGKKDVSPVFVKTREAAGEVLEAVRQALRDQEPAIVDGVRRLTRDAVREEHARAVRPAIDSEALELKALNTILIEVEVVNIIAEGIRETTKEVVAPAHVQRVRPLPPLGLGGGPVCRVHLVSGDSIVVVGSASDIARHLAHGEGV